jgi:hypothetical protein
MRALLSLSLLAAACHAPARPTARPAGPAVTPPDAGDPRIADLLAQLDAAEDPDDQARLHGQVGTILWDASCGQPSYGLCITRTTRTVAPRTTCAGYQLESVTSNIEPVARDVEDAAAAVAHFEAALAIAPSSASTGAARLALIDRDFEEAFAHPFPADLDFERDPQGASKTFDAWFTGTVARLATINDAYLALAADATLYAADPTYRFASAYRRGALAQWFADQLFAAPVPPNLQADEDLYQTYCDALFDQAEPLERNALATFKACVADAAAAGVTGVWPEQCQHELQALDPTLFD